MPTPQSPPPIAPEPLVTALPDAAPPPRTVVLVGMMGSGKSAIGKRMAARLRLPFVDADHEIERSAGMTIAEIFERHGEAEFRAGERRVIARLLDEPTHVLATGGGAFMDPATRAAVRAKGISLWLRADLEALVERVARRTHRPLLNGGDHRQILADLMDRRHPIYAEADITVRSGEGSADETTERALSALGEFIARHEALRP